MIIDLQSSDTWKNQLTIAVNFIYSKDTKEEHEMFWTSDNIKFGSYSDVNEVGIEIFESLLRRYQNTLEVSMRGSEFIFIAVQLLHYKCHKVNFKRGISYINPPVWIKNKATINSKNEDVNAFNMQQQLL